MPGQARHSQKYREASCLGDNETSYNLHLGGHPIIAPEITWEVLSGDDAAHHLNTNIVRSAWSDHPFNSQHSYASDAWLVSEAGAFELLDDIVAEGGNSL
jgi:hypothetical protein